MYRPVKIYTTSVCLKIQASGDQAKQHINIEMETQRQQQAESPRGLDEQKFYSQGEK